MPFATLQFVGFFAVLFFAYYTFPKRMQWLLLLAGSMYFYGCASPYYLLLLWATILVTYVGALGMTALYARRDCYLKANRECLSRGEKKDFKAKAERNAVWILSGAVVVLLAVLGIFKYAQFAADNFFALLGLVGLTTLNPQPSTLDIILPVGLSFYVFQSMGYCIDVFREEVPAERNLLKHALFVSYFPQIMQGPIGNYGRLAPQLLAEHTFNYEQAVFGIQRVAWGFFKKFMIANTIATRIAPCWGAVGDYPGSLCWLAILMLYAIELYADFSGYMDIACGCSQMLGVRIDENFNLPYFSKSIPEFWRRWHMTLSAWFKDYLFYPLLRSDWNAALRKRFAGNKYLASVLPTSAALLVVWFATGLWHGASWGYVAWGVYYGVLMIANVALQPLCDRFHAAFPRLVASRAYALFQMARTFLIVVVGYAIFRPADLGVTARIWKELASPKVGSFTWLVDGAGLVVFCWIAVLAVVDILHARKGSGFLRKWIATWPVFPRWALYVVGLVTMILFGVYNIPSLNQFAYFKF